MNIAPTETAKQPLTLAEFKAWFDGFNEAVSEAPTPEQWAKIKAKIAGIEPPRPAYTGIRAFDAQKLPAAVPDNTVTWIA